MCTKWYKIKRREIKWIEAINETRLTVGTTEDGSHLYTNIILILSIADWSLAHFYSQILNGFVTTSHN